MIPFTKAALSSVGKKIFMAFTGLFLVFFLVVHLAGNLALYAQDAELFNRYSHFLTSVKEILYPFEFVFLVFILYHIVTAVSITLGKWRARPQGYKIKKDLGPPSRKTLSSTTMIYTGSLILIFLVIHLATFKWGTEYSVSYHGEPPIRDLYRLVVEKFKNPYYSGFYVIVMALLGFHLRHGFWSAFQSLGLNHPRYNGLIRFVGVLIAIVLAMGFLFIPVYIYFFVQGGAA